MTEQSMAFTRDLSLPDAFTAGQVFAFSGMAGETSRAQDWCGVLTGERGEIRFGGVLLRFCDRASGFDVVLPDLIAADGGAILVTFADAQTIVGRSDTLPALCTEGEAYVSGSRTVCCGAYAFSLDTESSDGGVRFAFCRRADAQTAQADAHTALGLDADALAEQVLDWYQAAPPCPNPHFEKLWYKCLSVSRVNVFSPQDGSDLYSTTPARPAQQNETLWDACFHATAMVHYAPALAVDAVLSVLAQQRADGSIPHDADDVTQPPLLCAAVWNLFEATGDTALLGQTVNALRRYMDHELSHCRSLNGLMTRRCDTGEPVEAVDLSVFTAVELLCLHRIYLTLGEHADALQTEKMHRSMVERINTRLWNERAHCYYDRTVSGVFRRSLTYASFLPLYAGVCDPRQAHCLLTNLTPLLGLPFPIPSETDDDGRPARGSVWLHTNYFLYLGLQRYGFGRQAAALRQKTLDGVNKQFLRTGSIFDSYDPNGGDLPCPAADSNRSASFIELFLWS